MKDKSVAMPCESRGAARAWLIKHVTAAQAMKARRCMAFPTSRYIAQSHYSYHIATLSVDPICLNERQLRRASSETATTPRQSAPFISGRRSLTQSSPWALLRQRARVPDRPLVRPGRKGHNLCRAGLARARHLHIPVTGWNRRICSLMGQGARGSSGCRRFRVPAFSACSFGT
jgi:hypothetical protein